MRGFVKWALLARHDMELLALGLGRELHPARPCNNDPKSRNFSAKI